MTRALVTQLVEALESGLAYVENEANQLTSREYKAAIKAAREYLATELSEERAKLIAKLRDAHGRRFDTSPSPYSQAAEMLEADAQQAASPACPSCHAPGLLYECVHCSANSYPNGFVQQAKRMPMTDDQIQGIYIRTYNIGHHGRNFENAFARAIEAHHGITPADKPTGWDNGLSQDYCAEFGQWLASRPGARQQIKEMFEVGDGPEDLYALALKADNWGQP